VAVAVAVAVAVGVVVAVDEGTRKILATLKKEKINTYFG